MGLAAGKWPGLAHGAIQKVKGCLPIISSFEGIWESTSEALVSSACIFEKPKHRKQIHIYDETKKLCSVLLSRRLLVGFLSDEMLQGTTTWTGLSTADSVPYGHAESLDL